MRTLYIRNVPDEVAERLEDMARAEHLSVNALAVRELTEITRRASFDNAELLADLPSHSVEVELIVSAIQADRR